MKKINILCIKLISAGIFFVIVFMFITIQKVNANVLNFTSIKLNLNEDSMPLEQFLFTNPVTIEGLRSNVSYDYYYHFTRSINKSEKR